MKHINVETATREQLVDFVRCMHPQLQREQERVKELESQISGFQDFIHEKNAEIRELRQQSDRLTEKSASDEETIVALIKQMEAMRSEQAPASNLVQAPSTSSAKHACGRLVEQVTGKGHGPRDESGNERPPEAVRPIDAQEYVEIGCQPPRPPPLLKENSESIATQLKSQNAAAASTISNKTEEMAKLESKVRELMEVNAFYSAIVAQHDQEEKARMGQMLLRRDGQSEDDIVELRQELERLQFQMGNRDVQEEKLQRVIKATEAEKAALKQENEQLKKESVQLEAEMEEITRNYTRARRSLAAAASRQSGAVDVRLTYARDEGPRKRAVSAPQQGLLRDTSTRVPVLSSAEGYNRQLERRHASLSNASASRASPLSYDARQGLVGGGEALPIPSTSTNPASRSPFYFRSLRPIRVRNPDAHERDLLDRIHLYEEQLAQMELFEADRQRSFDEMERNRAEMFAAMNEQLEKQRKEIHRLRKLHEDASFESSLIARPSHKHSAGSVANREEDERRASRRRHGSHSPVERCLTAVPTSTQSLPNVESFSGVDDADALVGASSSERDTLTSRGMHQRHSTSSVLSPSRGGNQAEELKWQEREGRLLVWKEALENTVEIVSVIHVITAQGYADELAACNAKLLGEREALTAELESLQLNNEELKARMVELEAELHRSCVTAVDDRVTKASVTEKSRECALSNSSSSSTGLLEHKTLCLAFLAMEAYNSAVEHYSALLHDIGSSGVSSEVHEDCANFTEEVTRDLAEVHETLNSMKQQLQVQLQKLKEQSQSPYVVMSAAPLFASDPSSSQVPPVSNANAIVEDAAKHVYNDNSTATASPSSPPSSSTAPAHHMSNEKPTETTASRGISAVAAVALSSADTSLAASGKEEAEVPDPPYVFDSGATAAPISQDVSWKSSLDREAVVDDESGAGVPASDCTAPTEAGLQGEAEGEAPVHVSADEADGTAALQFEDCVKKDNGNSFTSATPGGVEKTSSATVVFEEGREAERPNAVSLAASGVGERKPASKEQGAGPSEPPSQPPPQITKDDFATADGDGHAGVDADSVNDAVELRDSDDSDAMSNPSQLEMTETEEAEFLAQLQKKVEDNGSDALVEPRSEEAMRAAIANSLSSSKNSEWGAEMPEVAGRTHSEVAEPALDLRSSGDESGTTFSAERGDETAGSISDAPYTQRAETFASVLAGGAFLEAEAEGVPSLSSNGETKDFHADVPPEQETGRTGSETNPSFPSLAPDLPWDTRSPNSSTDNHATQKPDHDVQEEVTGFEIGAASKTTLIPAAPGPSLLPPASLDVLFGSPPSAAPLPPPPPLTNETPSFSAIPIASQGAPSTPPPFPSRRLPETSRPSSPFATPTKAVPVLTLSPNSMFATPPRPVASGTFFTPSPHNGLYSQPQSSGKRMTQGETFSSSDGDFEAGFDPFA
jgi:hypothetical protein